MTTFLGYAVHGNARNLVGRRFGRLRVLSFHNRQEKGLSFFNCSCKCGNAKIIRGSNLTTGRTRSCGCVRKEVAVKNLKHAGRPVTQDRSRLTYEYLMSSRNKHGRPAAKV